MRGRRRRFEVVGRCRVLEDVHSVAPLLRAISAFPVIPMAGSLDNRVLGGQIGIIGWYEKMRLAVG